MPFIGRDWRSPGEAWVKTEGFGWQRAKIIESTYSYTSPLRRRFTDNCNDDVSVGSWPPKIINSSNFGHHHHHHPMTRAASPVSPSSPLDRKNRSHSHADRENECCSCCCCCWTPSIVVDDEQQVVADDQSAQRSTDHNSNQSSMLTSSSSPSITPDRQCVTTNARPFGHMKRSSTTDLSTCTSNESRCEQASNGECHHGNASADDTFASCSAIRRSVSPDCRVMTIAGQTNDVPTCWHWTSAEQQVPVAPHCQITLKSTREVANCNTISEAFYRLDFCNAIHDIRRFNYVCKLLHLLITQNLTSLSGCATKILFTMLEQVAWQVSCNKTNVHILYNLLDDLKNMIQKYYCWGRPIGSTALWRQHFTTIERISNMANQIDITTPESSSGSQMKITDLPCEMIREILLRLNDYRDLVNSARASSMFQSMLNSQHIWRQLCKYHFNKQQLRQALQNYYAQREKDRDHHRHHLSGTKFARTVSADGRHTCRRPVNHVIPDVHQSVTPSLPRPNQSIETNSTRTQQQIDRSANGEPTEVVKLLRAPKVSRTSRDFRDTQVSSSISRVRPKDIVPDAPRSRDRPKSMITPGMTSSTRAKLSNRTASMTLSSASSLSSFQQSRSVFDRSLSVEQPVSLQRLNRRPSSVATNYASARQPLSVRNLNRDCLHHQNKSEPSKEPKAKAEPNSAKQKENDQIDWEQMFHQLRKKFGLKEEYSDCLFLCRHCRCLFWKSFGHPCIKGMDDISTKHSVPSNPGGVSQSSGSVSVASLSRRFDGPNPQVAGQPNVFHHQPRQLDHNHGNFNNNNAHQQPPIDPNMARQHRALGLDINDDHQNVQNNSYNSGHVLPSHIAISPQAFLKFFSL